MINNADANAAIACRHQRADGAATALAIATTAHRQSEYPDFIIFDITNTNLRTQLKAKLLESVTIIIILSDLSFSSCSCHGMLISGRNAEIKTKT